MVFDPKDSSYTKRTLGSFAPDQCRRLLASSIAAEAPIWGGDEKQVWYPAPWICWPNKHYSVSARGLAHVARRLGKRQNTVEPRSATPARLCQGYHGGLTCCLPSAMHFISFLSIECHWHRFEHKQLPLTYLYTKLFENPGCAKQAPLEKEREICRGLIPAINF
jgi:hypothetical protein